MSQPLRALVLLSGLGISALSGCDGDMDPTDQETVQSPPELHVVAIAMRTVPPAPHEPGDPDAGWPAAGEEVEWVGRVYNTGSAQNGVAYEWSVDGERVAGGPFDAQSGENTVTLRRAWSGSRENIRLSVSPEYSAVSYDTLTVASDALTVGLWMNSGLAEYIEEDDELPPFPVWAGQQVRRWNQILASYSSSDGPAVVLDRIRLQELRVLAPGEPGGNWPSEINVDLFWPYFAGSNTLLRPGSPRANFQDQTVVLHELIHQRGIADLYAYWVWLSNDGEESVVRIDEPTGGPAAGGARMPFVREWSAGKDVFESPYTGFLMGFGYHDGASISPHTAYGLNKVAGRRTPRHPGAEVVGYWTRDYLLDVPDVARIRVNAKEGRVPAGTRVEVFFDKIGARANRFDAEPDEVLEADANGEVLIDLTRLQSLPAESAPGPDTIILRVTVGSEWGYVFLPVYELNMEYIRGHRDVGEVTVGADVS